MSFDSERLFELLPTIHRLRDGEGAGGTKDVLRALIDVIAGQVAVLEEDLAQLYDDQFIETCADWVIPYIGDAIGYRTLYGLTDKIGSPRAEVANTIAYRRRKGTASMLEQLARDVTGWNARVVEYFQLLATTQYMNHVRPKNIAWVLVRSAHVLAGVGTPFDTAAHTADARRIARRRGRFNIPNVGIHLWRIRDFPRPDSPAVKVLPGDPADRRYRFEPTGVDIPLFNHAVTEDAITTIATRDNVPMPITRRELRDDIDRFYPASVAVRFGDTTVPSGLVAASDLSDVGGTWAYAAADRVLIDPVLGRLSLPPTLMVNGDPVDMVDPIVSFHYGFSAEMGGGPYGRLSTFTSGIGPVVEVEAPDSIAAAITGLAGSGVVEVQGNARFEESLGITAAAGERIELRAADGARPAIVLGGDLVIDVDADAEVTLNGLLLLGAAVRVPASAGGRVRLRHCTLVPGATPNVIIESALVTVEIERCISGAIRADENASVRIVDSIVDAASQTGVAYAAADGNGPGAVLELVGSTVIGKVNARILNLVSNSIIDARLDAADTWTHPLRAEQRQTGCVRFSYVPPGSRTPSRHRCQPATAADAGRVRPQFTSIRYGVPTYGQLSRRAPVEIRTGADDESEIGAFHHLYAPQRETNIGVRLEEYLRFGLDAGIFYASQGDRS